MLPELFRSGPLAGWTIANLGGDHPPGFSHVLADDGAEADFPSCVACGPRRFVLSFGGLARFLVALDERAISVFDVQPVATPADIDHLLYDHVAPRIIAELGALVLHGSGVEIDGGLAMFLGETGAGKSTLAASLYREGFPLHGDDAVVISRDGDDFSGSAVYPSLRLYPTTITELFGDKVLSSPMAHYSDKQRVDLTSIAVKAASPARIAGLFFLANGPGQDEPSAELLRPSEACMAIVEQSFALDPVDPANAALRLAQSSALAAAIPAYRLKYQHDFSHIKSLHAVIFSCLANENAGPHLGRKAMVD